MFAVSLETAQKKKTPCFTVPRMFCSCCGGDVAVTLLWRYCGISGVSVGVSCMCVYVYFNSRNDVPRVAQWDGTIAAHYRRRASVLVVFVVCCVHMHSFAGLIRQTPLPTFSDATVTDHHSDTTISSSELTGCGYPGLLDRKKLFGHVPPVGAEPSTPCMQGEHPIH